MWYLVLLLAAVIPSVETATITTLDKPKNDKCDPKCSCYMDGVYYEESQNWTKAGEPCTTYTCFQDGVFNTSYSGCLFKGECKDTGSTWKEGCFTYACKDSGAYRYYELLESGCSDDQGRCFKVGANVKRDCDIFQCQIEGGKYVMKKIIKACEASGDCKALNSFWHDGCRVYKCTEDPNKGQAVTSALNDEIMQWPDGDYAMLKPSSGCPNDVGEEWREGYRKQYGSGKNNYSVPLDLFGEFTAEYMKTFFCVHKSVKDKSLIQRYRTYWEPGIYCVLQSGGICPYGFKRGYLQMDDAGDKIHLSENGGTLPDGSFADDTGLTFCCREDGQVTKDIVLPKKNSFVLFMASGEAKCQTVRGMTSSIQYMSFNDDNGGNKRVLNGTLPAINNDNNNNNTMLYFCHYKPIECGCTDKDGEVIALNSERTKDCVTKKCIFENGFNVMKIISGGCSVENKCKTIGEEWSALRGEGCVRQVCQMQMVNSTENFLVKDIGQDCTWMDSCKPVNSTWQHGCMTYHCDLGVGIDHYKLTVEPIEFGCNDGDKCYKIGEKVTRNCYEVVCKLSENRTTVYFDIVQEGCMWMGKCKNVNETWMDGCYEFTCIWQAPYMAVVNSTYAACEWKGQCKTVNEVWSEDCVDYICRVDRSENNVNQKVEPLKLGCKDSKNNCLAVGEQKTEGCITYKCVHYSLNVGLQVLAAGCDWKGVCKPENSTWTDDENCVDYRCNKLTLGGVTAVSTETIAYGCKWNGTCKPADATWSEDCLNRKCVVVVNATHVQRQVMSTVEGCQTVGSSECHAVDSTWMETHDNACTKLTCTRNGRTLRKKVLEKLCLDSAGKCHPVGASGFQAEIQGLVRTNCSCLARDIEAGVTVQCPG